MVNIERVIEWLNWEASINKFIVYYASRKLIRNRLLIRYLRRFVFYLNPSRISLKFLMISKNKFQIKFTQKENKKFREEFIPIFVRIQRFLVVLDTMREYIYIYINGTYLFFLKMSFQESYIYAFPESCVSHSSHSDGQIFLFHRWWAKFNNSSYFDDDLSFKT